MRFFLNLDDSLSLASDSALWSELYSDDSSSEAELSHLFSLLTLEPTLKSSGKQSASVVISSTTAGWGASKAGGTALATAAKIAEKLRQRWRTRSQFALHINGRAGLAVYERSATNSSCSAGIVTLSARAQKLSLRTPAIQKFQLRKKQRNSRTNNQAPRRADPYTFYKAGYRTDPTEISARPNFSVVDETRIFFAKTKQTAAAATKNINERRWRKKNENKKNCAKTTKRERRSETFSKAARYTRPTVLAAETLSLIHI